MSSEPSDNLIENQTYTFSCKSSAVPASTGNIIKLVDAHDEVVEQYSSINGQLTLQMTRAINGKTLVCESENEIGTTSINQTLDVSCNYFDRTFWLKCFLYTFIHTYLNLSF